MAAVPSLGRASGIERQPAPEADATRALYERYARQIFSYCLHQLSSREEAEDAVQTTFMNAFRGLKRGIVPEAEQAWLFKIAENVCLSRRRSSWRRGRVESPNDFEVLQEIVPSRATSSNVDLIGLEDALAAMPENQRRAILLREWQGLSYREISDELELSQSAVETLIFRARRTLAQGLEQPLPRKRGLRRAGEGLNLGSLLAGIKSLLTGGAVVKAAAIAAVATVAATQTERVVVSHNRSAPQATVTVSPQAEAAFSAAASIVAGATVDRTRTLVHSASPRGPVAAHGRAAAVAGEDAAPATTAPELPAVPAATPPAGDSGTGAEQPTAAGPKATPAEPATTDHGRPADDGNGNSKQADPPAATPADGAKNGNGNGKGADDGKKADPGPPASTPATPATPTDNNGNGKGDDSKKADPSPTPPAAGNGNGNGGDNGNAGGKKDTSPSVTPASQAPPAPVGNGNAGGNGNGADKSHGK